MATSNSSSWPPYPNYMDCSSQRLCSIYCPQWCYIFPPPPQFDLSNNDGHSSLASDFSPLIIAVIGVLATAFLLITYLTFMSKHCRLRGHDRNSISPEIDERNPMSFESRLGAPAGLDEAIIKSIAVCKFKKGDGFVDGTECSVCLGEFEEDDSLRLLPKCSHAFHLPCIDTWLQSHATCPLCRCSIPPVIASAQSQFIEAPAPAPEPTDTRPDTTNDTVLVVQDLETRAQQEAVASNAGNECIIDINEKRLVHPIRRSVSLDSSSCQDRILIADVLHRVDEDDREPVTVKALIHPNRSVTGNSYVNRNSDAMPRSVSTGRSCLVSNSKHFNDKDSTAAPS